MANRPRRSRKRGPKAARKQQSLAASASQPTPAPAPEAEATPAPEPMMAVVREPDPEPAPAVVEVPPRQERLDPVAELAPRPALRPAEVAVPIPLAVERPALPAVAGPELPGWRAWPARVGAMLRDAAAFGSASAGRLIARSAHDRTQASKPSLVQSITRADAGPGGMSAGSSADVRAGEAVYARVVASVERHAIALARQRRRGIVRNDFGRAVDTQGWLDSRAAYVDRYLALSAAEYRALGAYFRTVERAAVQDESQVRTRLTNLVLERELERCLANRVTEAEALVQSHAAGVDAAD